MIEQNDKVSIKHINVSKILVYNDKRAQQSRQPSFNLLNTFAKSIITRTTIFREFFGDHDPE